MVTARLPQQHVMQQTRLQLHRSMHCGQQQRPMRLIAPLMQLYACSVVKATIVTLAHVLHATEAKDDCSIIIAVH